MPCYDPETHERPIRLEAKVQHLTALLCWLCGKSDAAVIADNRDLAQWWRQHQEQDALIEGIRAKYRTSGYESLTARELEMFRRSEDASL